MKTNKFELSEESSDAMKLLHFTIYNSERKNKRDFIIIIVLILSLTISVGYNIYQANSIDTIETTSSTIDIDDVDNINNSEIRN